MRGCFLLRCFGLLLLLLLILLGLVLRTLALSRLTALRVLSVVLRMASFAGIDMLALHRLVAKPFKRLVLRDIVAVALVVLGGVVLLRLRLGVVGHNKLHALRILDHVDARDDLEAAKVLLADRLPGQRRDVDYASGRLLGARLGLLVRGGDGLLGLASLRLGTRCGGELALLAGRRPHWE